MGDPQVTYSAGWDPCGSPVALTRPPEQSRRWWGCLPLAAGAGDVRSPSPAPHGKCPVHFLENEANCSSAMCMAPVLAGEGRSPE